MGRVACNEDSPRDGVVNDRVAEAKARSDFFKRAVAILALGVGGIATFVWVVLLGWALTETLSTKTLRLKSNPSAQHASAAPLRKPGMGYKQPSVLK
jgi:hypothetical protein